MRNPTGMERKKKEINLLQGKRKRKKSLETVLKFYSVVYFSLKFSKAGNSQHFLIDQKLLKLLTMLCGKWSIRSKKTKPDHEHKRKQMRK